MMAGIFLVTSLPVSCAQTALPEPGTPVALSPAFTPMALRGIKIYPNDPFRFDFVVDKGNAASSDQDVRTDSSRLIRYFLAALTTPEKDLWVNLSPYESDRIVQDDFGRTAMGRDLLAQDYILKQITASLIHPDNEVGKKFWAEVYRRAWERYGTTDIPIDTFNKVWIVPSKAVIYEKPSVGEGLRPSRSGTTGGSQTRPYDPATSNAMAAFIDEARLKVMLETDYLAASKSAAARPTDNDQDISKQVMREIVLPALEKEVNEGKNFAALRQVYYSLLLAVWFKKKLAAAAQVVTVAERPGMARGNLMSMIFVDQHKTAGVESEDPKNDISGIYDRYVEAFKKGAYNLIREDRDIYSQELIPRKYFSGGVEMRNVSAAMSVRKERPQKPQKGSFSGINVQLRIIGNRNAGTGFFIEKHRNGKTDYYFQTTGRALALVLLAGSLMAFVAGFYKSRPEVVAEVQAQLPAVVQVWEQKPKLQTTDVEKSLDAVARGYQQYRTGLLHNQKNPTEEQKAALRAPLQTREEMFASMSDSNREVINAQWLRDFFHDRYEKFGQGLKAAGLSETDMLPLLLSMGNIESGLNVSESNAISRGIFQFQRLTWETLRHVIESLPAEQQKLLERVRNEDSRRLGKGALWHSQSTEDAVVQTKEHITMAILGMNYLMTERPSPIEQEYARLDRILLDKLGFREKGDVLGKKISASPLKDILLRLMQKHSQNDLKRALMFHLPARWNQGGNISDKQTQEYELYRELSPQGKKDFQQQAALDVRKFIVARGAALDLIKAVTRGVLSDEQRGYLISSDPKIRLNAFLNLAPKFSGREKEKKLFITAWQMFHFAETGLADASWRMGPCVRGSAYAFKAVAIAEDPDQAYQLGLGYRNIYKTTAKAKKSVEEAKKQQRRALVASGSSGNWNNNASIKRKSRRYDRAMSSGDNVGGIDLQTDQMDFAIQGNAGDFQVEIPAAQLEILKNDVQGFVPLILGVETMTDVPGFLGMAEGSSGNPV